MSISYSNMDITTHPTEYLYSEPVRDIQLNPTLTGKVFNRETGHPIPYSLELATFFKEQVILAFRSPNPLYYDPPEMKTSSSVNGELKRFIVALASFLDPRNYPKQSLAELVNLITDPNACSYLKKLRFNSMVKFGFTRGRFAESDPDLEELPVKPITDIGQVFNYRFWIFWEEEDPKDEQYAWKELKPIPPDVMDEYAEALRSVLPAHVEQVDPREILLSVTGSGAVPEGSQMSSKVYIEKGRINSNRFDYGPIHSKLVYIQKSPGDSRRASVLTVPQSNSIKFIEKQCSAIAEQMLHSCYVKDPLEFQRRYEEFKSTCTRFLCRDIKKDGLTKPRAVLTRTLHEICKKYPYLEFFSMFKNFYSNWTYYLAEEPEKIFNPPRGVGLGMSSALTTILQCAIFQMTYNRLLRDGDYGVGGIVRGLFYHDDAAVGSDNQDDLDNFDSEETTVLDQLGFIKNLKKTFEADQFVLCERYSNNLDDKLSYQLNLLNAPFMACNITHAKELVQTIVKYKCDFDVRAWISSYTTYWGYEFDVEEAVLPSKMGGWIPAEYKGVDTTFMWYDPARQRLCNALIIASSSHNLERPIKKSLRYIKTPYVSPCEQLFGSNLDCGDQSKYFHYKVPLGEMHVLMSNFNTETSLVRGYSLLRLKRLESFRKEMASNQILSCTQIYNMYCEYNELKDVLPPEDIAEAKPISDFVADLDYDPDYLYKSVNPKMAFLAFHNPGNYHFRKMIPSPVPPLFSIFGDLRPTSEDRISTRHQQNLLAGHMGFHHRKVISIPKSSYDFSSTSWVCPYNVAAAWSAYHFTNSIPTRSPKHGIWEEISSYRNSHFNKWFGTTKFKMLFLFCVDILGWHFMAKEEYMDDEFLENLLWELAPDYQAVADAPQEVGIPERTPLPRPTIQEILFLGGGFEVPIQIWHRTGNGPEDEGDLNRGYNSGYSSSDDTDVLDFDQLNPHVFVNDELDSEPEPTVEFYIEESSSEDERSTSSSGSSSYYESVKTSLKSESEETWDPGGSPDV